MPKVIISIVFVGIITLAVYWQVGNYDFVSIDDGIYVTKNPNVVSGLKKENVVRVLTSIDKVTGYWLPITFISHMADVQFYGMNPRGHHLTNVVIHIVATLLLLLLLFRLTNALLPSTIVAALFAIHPMHVESVAWVAERKDVLSAFFCFLTLLLYAEYVSKRKPCFYILSLISFVLGLMSKPMLVTLPLIMLLIDLWPLERFQQRVQELGVLQLLCRALDLAKEKTPFFVCSFLSGMITSYAQNEAGAVISFSKIPLLLRIENALISYFKYIGLTLWPHDLAVLYPYSLAIPYWQVIGSLLFLILISVAAFLAKHQYPYVAVGWLWFLVTLVPVIGLIQSGTQSMADRFSYIPSIGLFIVFAWGVIDLTMRLKHRKIILFVITSTVITSSAALTSQQIAYWEDDFTLFRHTLQVTSDNYLIHNNLGVALYNAGSLDEAILEFREALRIKFDYKEAHCNLGTAYYETGLLDDSIKEFQLALMLDPNYVDALRKHEIAIVSKKNSK